MTTPADDITFHDNNFMVTLAKHLHLDPSHITNMTVTGESGGDEVIVSWEGYTTMPSDEFNVILDAIDHSKVSRSSE
jgi:hypothetical protein